MPAEPTRDFEDLLALLGRHEVRYLIVGGLAFVTSSTLRPEQGKGRTSEGCWDERANEASPRDCKMC